MSIFSYLNVVYLFGANESSFVLAGDDLGLLLGVLEDGARDEVAGFEHEFPARVVGEDALIVLVVVLVLATELCPSSNIETSHDSMVFAELAAWYHVCREGLDDPLSWLIFSGNGTPLFFCNLTVCRARRRGSTSSCL